VTRRTAGRQHATNQLIRDIRAFRKNVTYSGLTSCNLARSPYSSPAGPKYGCAISYSDCVLLPLNPAAAAISEAGDATLARAPSELVDI